jgi:predicted lipoprotein
MDACAELNQSLEALKTYTSTLSEENNGKITAQFVDYVVMPTYQNLVAKNKALLTAVKAFQAAPSNTTFASACEAWLAARQPWETSEAFLFGPVSDLGLDPNMDSWPLDADGIYQLLKTQQWADMQWSGDYDEESEAIEAAQALRGYHTLEYLLFKDGQPRKVER